MSSSSYETWSKEELIDRVKKLEGRTHSLQNTPVRNPSPTRADDLSSISLVHQVKNFDFASCPRRKIALKFCYSGWEYNGLAYQSQPTPLPTVESVIFDALTRAKLIDPAAGYDGCGWEKCGRTDRGVSAGGQVISLWVRSALEKNISEAATDGPTHADQESGEEKLRFEEDSTILDDGFGSLSLNDSSEDLPAPLSSPPQTLKPELDYIAILNSILPSTIRILAWSPVSATFSARFACRCRHYKYFFSSEHLDISKMRDAASRMLGLHDFRNLCKLDPAKQITIFDRRILSADIDPVDPSTSSTSSMYVLNLIGTAFLYHQVRHIMAVLFLVGRGLEHPSVMTALLNTKEGAEKSQPGELLEVVDCKPEYQMADPLPLMLWDCIYSDEDVGWRTDGHQPRSDSSASTEDGRGIYHLLYSIRSRSEIYLALNQHFLNAASLFFSEPWATTKEGIVGIRHRSGNVIKETPLGGGTSRKVPQYVSLLKRRRLDPVDVVNERWRNGKGSRRHRRKETGENESDQEDE